MSDVVAVVMRMEQALAARFGPPLERTREAVSWRSGDVRFAMCPRTGDVWLPRTDGGRSHAAPRSVRETIAAGRTDDALRRLRVTNIGEAETIEIVEAAVDAPFRRWAAVNGAAIGEGVRLYEDQADVHLHNINGAVIVDGDGSVSTFTCHTVEIRQARIGGVQTVHFGRYHRWGFHAGTYDLMRSIRIPGHLHHEHLHLAGIACEHPHRLRVRGRTIAALRVHAGQSIIPGPRPDTRARYRHLHCIRTSVSMRVAEDERKLAWLTSRTRVRNEYLAEEADQLRESIADSRRLIMRIERRIARSRR